MSDACGFCGHADAPEKVYAPLRSCIEELICRQGVREFYVDSEGAFDRMALRALRRCVHGMRPPKGHFLYTVFRIFADKKRTGRGFF